MNPAAKGAAVLALAIVSSGCFQMTTVMKVKGDGSGTIDHRMLFTRQALAQLRQFAALGGGRQAVVRKASRRESHLILELRQGRNREIRRMFSAIGHEVTRLHRVRFGGLELDDLQPGRWRELTRTELRAAFPRYPRL